MGFTSKERTMEFLAASDITPEIDWVYVDRLMQRLRETILRLNQIVSPSIRHQDPEAFLQRHLDKVVLVSRQKEIVKRLNNRGRRPEEVFFSWMRGYVITEFFCPALSRVFGVTLDSINRIGEDTLAEDDTFRRAPTADLEITVRGTRVRIEVQSGYKERKDIKQHKVEEAHRMLRSDGVRTVDIHFDLFDGRVAFVQLDSLPLEGEGWVARKEMEGQHVFEIQEKYFKWQLLDEPPRLDDLGLVL